MIHYLLYSVPKDEINKSRIKYAIFFFISLLVMTFSALLFFYKIDNRFFSLASLISFVIGSIILIVNLIILESFKKRTVRIDYCEFNEELDTLRTILKNAEYDDPSDTSANEKPNWYTKKKIKYLIKEFDKLSSDKTKNGMSGNPLTYYLLSVISFAACAIADKASLKTILTVAVVAFVGILVCWCIIQTIKDLGDAISYSTSDNNIKRIYDLLNNLYIRDFDDSAPVNTNDSTQSNTP